MLKEIVAKEVVLECPEQKVIMAELDPLDHLDDVENLEQLVVMVLLE